MSGPPISDARRWAWRIAVGSALAFGLSAVTGLVEIRAILLVLTVVAAGWLGWVIWDERRGQTHRVERLRDLWERELGAYFVGETMTLPHPSGLPLQVRPANHRGRIPAATLLIPRPITTVGFRLWPARMPRPSFDGREPSVGGPHLERLPGVERIASDLFADDGEADLPPLCIEGNAPDRVVALLQRPVRRVLADTLRLHPETFRGISFDGSALAIHWLAEAAEDPLVALHATQSLLGALLHEAPPPSPVSVH